MPKWDSDTSSCSCVAIPSSAEALPKVKNLTYWAYRLAFPIAVVVGVLKILINLIVLATSAGDPAKLQQVKEELYAILMGLLLIGGAATLVNALGGALGV